MSEYVIVCLKRSTDDALVYWQAENSGHTASLGIAGRYAHEAVQSDPSYYDNGMSTLAVRCDELSVFCGRVETDRLMPTVRAIVLARSPSLGQSPIPTSRPTLDEQREHFSRGIGDNCLVCDKPLYGSWTDYNGEIRCEVCGTTYQILGDHLTDEGKAMLGITKEQIAKRYCNCFEVVPLLRDYWHETRRKIPFGQFLGRGPITEQEHHSFVDWLLANSEKYRPEYVEDFRWAQVMKEPEQVNAG